jgi:hypothetical protein
VPLCLSILDPNLTTKEVEDEEIQEGGMPKVLKVTSFK